MNGDSNAWRQDQDRRDRWLAPHPFNPDRRYLEYAIDPWHYTNRQGLEGIISSNTLWATESGGLNDPSEVVRASEGLLAAWERSVADLKPQAEALAEDVDRWLREMTEMVSQRRFFFVSACYEGDKLHHWRSYASGQGYAIELDRNREFRLLEPASGPGLYWPGFAPNPWWRPVTYGDYETGRTARGASLLAGGEGVIERAFDAFDARARGDVPDEVAFWEHLERVYLVSICFNKHEGYSEEEEARMVFVEPPWAGFVHERVGGFHASGRTAFMKVAAAPIDEPDTYSISNPELLPIRSIRIGPRYGTEVDREVEEVAGFLRDHGYVNVEVTASTIPFRG